VSIDSFVSQLALLILSGRGDAQLYVLWFSPGKGGFVVFDVPQNG